MSKGKLYFRFLRGEIERETFSAKIPEEQLLKSGWTPVDDAADLEEEIASVSMDDPEAPDKGGALALRWQALQDADIVIKTLTNEELEAMSEEAFATMLKTGKKPRKPRKTSPKTDTK